MTEEITEEKAKIAYCPNCNKPAIRRGKVIDCENCDASFRYTQEGPKVDKVGKISELESRVAALEGKNKPAANDSQDDEPNTVDEDEE